MVKDIELQKGKAKKEKTNKDKKLLAFVTAVDSDDSNINLGNEELVIVTWKFWHLFKKFGRSPSIWEIKPKGWIFKSK